MGSPTSDQFGKFGDAKLGYSNITSSSIPENSDSGDVAIDNSVGSIDQVNEDSPYGMNVVSVEDRPSSGDEDSDPVAPPVPSVSASHSEHRWGDTNSYVAKKKLQSWFQRPNGKWELAKILSILGTESVIALPDEKVLKVQTESLVPSNLDILDGVDDLMHTKARPMLVVINPFKKVSLYGNEYLDAYKRKTNDTPHVYAITDTTIREMIRDEVNQSIIIRVAWDMAAEICLSQLPPLVEDPTAEFQVHL
ncbi:myosin-1-like isoform X2 [Humulus lupulus]|uniref:myosin-1-like isoform X2 n=1 Tax=Humulus lupulus TaxID=3486 RepID=UPI002B40F0AE|nr:myosin-1-like isoform X2 [Humulus lupulus]